MVLIRAHDELNSACPFPRSAGESSLRVQLGTPLPLQHGRAGIRCQEQPNLGATSGRATTSAAPARSSQTRPSVWRALTAAAAGWGCGSACPAAGWPAPIIPLTITPEPTIKRPTTRSPYLCDRTQGHVGATSTNAPSERSIAGRPHPSSWRRVPVRRVVTTWSRSPSLRGPRTTRLIPGGYAAAGSTV
jgi:hypothetical protein